MDKDDKPKLSLVAENGETVSPKGKPGRAGKFTESGLTTKMEAFAQSLANGLSNSDAYREAYNTGNMKPGTLHSEACKLAADPRIAKRVDELIAEKRRKNSMFSDKQREKYSDRVWRNLWAMIDAPDTPPAVKANLLSLGAKAAGMLTEQVRLENVSSDSKSIEQELLERLQRLRA